MVSPKRDIVHDVRGEVSNTPSVPDGTPLSERRVGDGHAHSVTSPRGSVTLEARPRHPALAEGLCPGCSRPLERVADTQYDCDVCREWIERQVVGYRTIVADPPWPIPTTGAFNDSRPGRILKRNRTRDLGYPTMSSAEIAALPLPAVEEGCHLWLWTTNSHLEIAFRVMRTWGFQYLTTITWVRPSGRGAWFASTTQHCLFGYYKTCRFPLRRWAPTHFHAPIPQRHSEKPDCFFDLVESISPEPRLELFSRRARFGWDVWGDEVDTEVVLSGL